MQSMKELSGGEKSIVALSLLLSLNSLTNTQIYLLDEVDGALDQSYRAGLAELLTKISHGGEPGKGNSLEFKALKISFYLIDSHF